MKDSSSLSKQITWVIHCLSYYICWFVCVYSASLDYEYLGLIITLFIIGFQVFWQILHNYPWSSYLIYAMFITFLGSVTDTFWLYEKFIYFHANPFGALFSPLWMSSLWLSFGFNIILLYRDLINSYLIWGGVAFLSLPFAYWLGVKFGAAEIIINQYKFYFSLGLTWFILLPLSFWVYDFFKKEF